jgi:hypothetical protein
MKVVQYNCNAMSLVWLIGPGPMEAIANGCAYIQPKFIPPRNKYNDDVMRGKPTARFYNSQVPYLEDYVGEPYVG